MLDLLSMKKDLSSQELSMPNTLSLLILVNSDHRSYNIRPGIPEISGHRSCGIRPPLSYDSANSRHLMSEV